MINNGTKHSNISEIQEENIDLDSFPYTKFLIPNSNNRVLERNRLLQRLKAINEKKLTSISAPAGFGKTTLVSTWIKNMGFEQYTAWVSLYEEDNGLRMFWEAVITSIDILFPKQFVQCLNILKAYQPNPVDSIINLFINKLGSLPNNVFIVLDDFHVISNSEIHRSLQYFLKRLPSNVHILLTSRHKPSKFISAMKIKDEILDLYYNDLRFTFEETNQFIKNTLNLAISKEEIEELYTATDGWITAIKLYANSLSEKHQLSPRPTMSGVFNKYLVNYLTEEAISMLPENIKDFLIKSSILNTLNVSLCDYVLEIENSLEILEFLEAHNIFIYALDDESRDFRYFDLFRNFMQSKLSSLSKDYLSSLYMRASEWYEHLGLYTSAIEYSLKTTNYKNSVKLLEKCSKKYVQKAEFARLINYIEKIPSEYINGTPIAFDYACALINVGKLDEDQLYLKNRGINLDSKEFENHKGSLAAITAFHSASVGYYTGLLEKSLYALSLLDKNASHASMAHFTAAYAYMHQLKIEEATLHIEQGIEIAAKLNNMYALIMCVQFKAEILMMSLKLDESISVYESILSSLNDGGEEAIQVSNYLYLGLGSVYYESNNIELAQKYISRSIELSELRSDDNCLLQAYLILAKILAGSDEKSALSYIEKIEALRSSQLSRLGSTQLSRFGILLNLLDSVRGLIILGRLDLAESVYTKYTINTDDELKYLTQLPLLDILITKKRYSDALDIIKEIDSQNIDKAVAFIHFYLCIYKALIYKGLEKKEDALLFLSKALFIVKDEGWIRRFVDFGEPMFIMINEFLEMDKYSEIYDGSLRETGIKILLNFNTSLLTKTQPNILSDREHEILSLVSQGLTNAEIAEKLFLALITVKKHLSSAFTKLKVSNRVQAVEAYRKLIDDL